MRAVGTLLTAAVTAACPALVSASVAAPLRAPVPAVSARLGVAPRLVTNPIARPVAPSEVRAAVTGVSVVAGPAAGPAVVIRVEHMVAVQDFKLEGPHRIVLDLAGTTLAVSGAARYDGATRGGIVNVRLSQFRAGIVRVVVELDASRTYRIERTEEAVRLVMDGESGPAFTPWQVGGASAAPSTATPAVAAAAVQPSSAPRASVPAADSATEQTQSQIQPPARSAVPVMRAPAPPTARELQAARREAARDAVAQEQQAVREQAARARTAEGVASRAVSSPRDGQRLTQTYQDADIRDVVAAFAAFSGRTIIVGREVAGTITAEIKDQPWDVALRALLRAQGLAATEDANGIITVDSYSNLASNRATEPIATQIIDVNYAKADSLVPLVQTLLSRDCAPGDIAGASAAAAAANPGQSGGNRRAAAQPASRAAAWCAAPSPPTARRTSCSSPTSRRTCPRSSPASRSSTSARRRSRSRRRSSS